MFYSPDVARRRAGIETRIDGPAVALVPFPVPGHSSLFSLLRVAWLLGAHQRLSAGVRPGAGRPSAVGASSGRCSMRGCPPDVAHHLCAGFLHCGSFVGPECVLWAVSCCWGWGRCWLPHINIGANVWGESNIMTDVY